MPRRIVLYTLVPSDEQQQPLTRSLRTRTSYALGNAMDRLDWRLRRRFAFKPYRFERFRCSNIGDMAVRAAVADVLAEHLDAEVVVEELRWGRLTAECVEEINRSASLMLIAGGGYLAANRRGELTPFARSDLERLEQLAVPLVSFGIGLNVNLKDSADGGKPTLSGQARVALGRFADRHALLGVRDPFTRGELAPTAGREVTMIPDPVFFLRPGPAMRAAPRAAPGDKPLVGLNFAFHGPHVAGNLARNFGRYLQILGRLRERTGCRFVYFPHSDPERLVFELLRTEGLVERCANFDSPSELIEAYGQVDLLIGEMMHAAIMALSAGTPVVSVGYDVKHRALFELLDLGHLHLDPLREPLEEVETRAAAVLADWTAERRRVVERLGVLAEPYDDFSAKFAATLRQHDLARHPKLSPTG